MLFTQVDQARPVPSLKDFTLFSPTVFGIVSLFVLLYMPIPPAVFAQEPADCWLGESRDRVCSLAASLDLRYRYESVDQVGFSPEATASLIRARLALAGNLSSSVSGRVELDHVFKLGSSDYNSTENGESQFPVIADPTGTDLNQAWVKFTAAHSQTWAGRQRIVLGDKRFIGSKPWRNNEQTYDGLRTQWGPSPRAVLDMSYVNRVNRVFGPSDGANPAAWKGNNVFIRGDYQADSNLTLSGFAYLVDVEPASGFAPQKTVNNSSTTLGLELIGEWSDVSYKLAMATQEDAGESELSYRAPYYALTLSAPVSQVTLGLGFENLGSDRGVGFATPLANGHRYQGWADQFLGTPENGVRDIWASVEARLLGGTMMARYHQFQADAAGEDYGSELDLRASWQVSSQWRVTVKGALFDANKASGFRDTTKAWLMLEYKI